MRSCLFMVALLPLAAFGTLPAHGQDAFGWRTYIGPRYGTSVQIPGAILAPAGPADTGVGERFNSTDGRASLSIYALSNEAGSAPADYLERNLRIPGSAIQYKRVARSFFAISTEQSGTVYYSRCNFTSNPGAFIHCFDLQYPQTDKALWDPIVTRISRTLRPLSDNGPG